MNSEGHIKLFRKMLDWEWYKDINTTRLFIHCLLRANWKEQKFQGNIIPRGSFVTSYNNLADEIGLTYQQTRTALDKLKSTNEITIKSTNKFTIISVEKYNDYQDYDFKNNTQNNGQITNKQQTNNTQDNKQITTIEEYKEYKNINNINNIYTSTSSEDDEPRQKRNYDFIFQHSMIRVKIYQKLKHYQIQEKKQYAKFQKMNLNNYAI